MEGPCRSDVDTGDIAERIKRTAQGLGSVAFQNVLAATLEDSDKGRRRMMLNSGLFARSLWSMAHAHISPGQCFESIRSCRVDARTRDLRRGNAYALSSTPTPNRSTAIR